MSTSDNEKFNLFEEFINDIKDVGLKVNSKPINGFGNKENYPEDFKLFMKTFGELSISFRGPLGSYTVFEIWRPLNCVEIAEDCKQGYIFEDGILSDSITEEDLNENYYEDGDLDINSEKIPVKNINFIGVDAFGQTYGYNTQTTPFSLVSDKVAFKVEPEWNIFDVIAKSVKSFLLIYLLLSKKKDSINKDFKIDNNIAFEEINSLFWMSLNFDVFIDLLLLDENESYSFWIKQAGEGQGSILAKYIEESFLTPNKISIGGLGMDYFFIKVLWEFRYFVEKYFRFTGSDILENQRQEKDFEEMNEEEMLDFFWSNNGEIYRMNDNKIIIDGGGMSAESISIEKID